MKTKDAEKELNKAWNIYWKQVEELAEKVFESEILPWLKQKNYDFLSGNGAFLIFYKNEKGRSIFIDDWELPKKIQSALSIEIPGLVGYPLGTIMPNYGKDESK